MRQVPALYSFNHGLISALALARVDQKRVSLAAETMNNWMPRLMGCMSLRPGLGYLGATASNAAARYLSFVFATTDTALLELTNLLLRVWVSDALITRVSVASAITNGTFAGNITNWTVSSGNVTYLAPNQMQFGSNGTADETAYQTVTVVSADQGHEHALRIVVNRGPIRVRVGSTAGGQEYITETILRTGTHSIAFTPTGDFTVYFLSNKSYSILLGSCTIEAAGVMTLPTPWLAADLGLVRTDQSADIVFCACVGYQQRQIERHSSRSYSVVLYQPEDGPFKTENITPTTISASALNGNVTLTASVAIFKSTHVGALFTLTSRGQQVTKNMTALNDVTTSVLQTDVGTNRAITIVLTGLSATGNTVILQRSFDNSTWTAVSGKSWVADTVESYNDGLDNQIVYYRLKCTVYAGGTTVALLSVDVGSIVGVARIYAYSSPTAVSASTLSDFGATSATDEWSEGNWSDFRGWPSAVRLYEGRLWWFGKNGVWGSISDQFDSFDPAFAGDAGPINRTIGSGPVDTINWAIALTRMIVGAQGAELSVKSSSLDEPLTPTNFNIKPTSTQGSAGVEPCVIDKVGAFVDRSQIKVLEVAFDAQSYDFGSSDLTMLNPELGYPGIVRMAVQRKPDTRIHCVRSDGVAMIAVFEKVEDVLCWLTVTTDGLVEDVVVLPGLNGSTDDQVYYVVKRTINGSTVRYLEKWAKETECRGSTLNKQADAFVLFSGASATITGLSHLEGEAVIVWADGVDLSPGVGASQTTYTVSGGQITVASTVSSAVVGLPYQSQWKSAKLSQQPQSLTQKKRGNHLGLVLAYTHASGLQFGPDFDHLNDMPQIERGTSVGTNAIRTAYDEQPIEFPVTWDSDSRLCLQANAPRPVTVMAALPDMDVNG